jgi:hypothetical protein
MEITERIKRFVREWMERMMKIRETKTSGSNDSHIDCPKCRSQLAVQFDSDKGWMCVWRDCHFTFPPGLVPPSPREFEAYLDRKELDKRIEMFLDSE